MDETERSRDRRPPPGPRLPLQAGDLLRSIVREVGSKAQRSRFSDALAAAVGERLAEHVSVLGFRKGKLGIQVESAPLLAELRGFRAEEIRQSMNAALERDGHGDRISEITFRIAGTGHA